MKSITTPQFLYRSCFSYFSKLKVKVDLDQIAKEVQQQKMLINSPKTKNIDEFLAKYQRMKNISKDYEQMQQTHKDYPQLAQFQMSRTLDMEKTSKRIGQVQKSQKNNLENMNKSTKAMQTLKNELYELYFQLENQKYDLKSTIIEMTELKSFLKEQKQDCKQINHEEVIEKAFPLIVSKGDMFVDIQERVRGIRPQESELYQQIQSIKDIITSLFQNRGYTIFDNSYNNFQRYEKEYFCLDSSVPGILELIQSRINISEKSKILVFTPIVNKQFNGLADIKIEIISENDSQSIEEDLITMLKDCSDVLTETTKFSSFKIENIMDESKSQITLGIQEGKLLTIRSYGNYISKRMNLKMKHFIGEEQIQEISCINVGEISSLFTLLLYKEYLKNN